MGAGVWSLVSCVQSGFRACGRRGDSPVSSPEGISYPPLTRRVFQSSKQPGSYAASRRCALRVGQIWEEEEIRKTTHNTRSLSDETRMKDRPTPAAMTAWPRATSSGRRGGCARGMARARRRYTKLIVWLQYGRTSPRSCPQADARATQRKQPPLPQQHAVKAR